MDDLKPQKRKTRKGLVWFVALLAVSLTLFIYVRYYYVYSSGVKSGELNYLVYRGVVFKTWEGQLTEERSSTDGAEGLETVIFDFSVLDKEIADILMLSGGNMVQLHYREYFSSLPWRGDSKFIVDSIMVIDEPVLPTPPLESTPDNIQSI